MMAAMGPDIAAIVSTCLFWPCSGILANCEYICEPYNHSKLSHSTFFSSLCCRPPHPHPSHPPFVYIGTKVMHSSKIKFKVRHHLI